MENHWRNSQKPARFFGVDARAFSAIFFFLIHARLWTFILAILVMFLFWLFERRGLTFEAACRSFRTWFLGRYRPASLTKYKRKWTDFGN
jgi:intracellular multiplication protein IcmT